MLATRLGRMVAGLALAGLCVMLVATGAQAAPGAVSGEAGARPDPWTWWLRPPWTRTGPTAPGPLGTTPLPRTPGAPDRGYVVFEHHTLDKLPGGYVPRPQQITEGIHCALARGEYNAAQIGVHALSEDLSNVRISVTSPLPVTMHRRADPGIAAGDPFWGADWAPLQSGELVEHIPAGSSANFWFTFHAPAEAAPGLHRGRLRVSVEGRPSTHLDLALEVRPFELAPARIPFGMYYTRNQYYPGLHPPHEVLYRDMAEHGHNSVTFYGERDFGMRSVDWVDVIAGPPSEDHPMASIIATAQEAGLVSEHLPCMLLQGPFYSEWREGRTGLTPAQLEAAVAWAQEQQRTRQWPEIMAYGSDEPPVPMEGMRQFYTALRSLPIRLGTAMSAKPAYAYGDLHDAWIVVDGEITPEMQAEAERLGAEVWTYEYRLWRQGHDPLIIRHYAGLYTWALQLEGNWVWSYYYGYNWVHPDSGETMPTTGWAARREGIGDYRYLQMLEDAIAARPGDPLAAAASRWLADLRAQVVPVEPQHVAPGRPLAFEDYDRIRERAADYLQRLGPVPADQILPSPPTHLKDEAEPFRGRSVEECLTGLRSPQVSVRRAAATALFELGPEAAPAVEALAACLDDPEVRFPALRALEAIGSASRAAVPQLAPLAQHPDGFVRMGALYALGATGAPPLEVLTPALRDKYHPAAEVAGEMMTALGPAALPALPVLIELLDGPGWEQQGPALKAIEGIGPGAAEAVPHILRHWQGQFPGYRYWIEPLAAIGPAAQAAVPMLESFRADRGAAAMAHREAHAIEAIALYALYSIRRAPEDLRELVALIGGEGGGAADPAAALGYVERLGPLAAPAAPQIRELIAEGDVTAEVRQRLEQVLAALPETDEG